MPYIHWDTVSAFKQRNDFVMRCLDKKPSSIPGTLPQSTKRLYQAIKNDINGPNSMHPRRSLDQYFYPSLTDTSSRDNDQVVSKRTKDSPGGPTMVMVDQLWLWLISLNDGSKSVILTCFPQKEVEEGHATTGIENDTDLYHAILSEMQSHYHSTALQYPYGVGPHRVGIYMVSIIIEHAINKMLGYRGESLDFLSIFQGAIRQAVSRSYFHKEE